ncbi:MAG: pyridoxamine 5'-phosphate oxidase family protein [Phycisphaerae bacterium]|nr:pyridoxamine 5'-phosphate oxidase family protein [Phycisphaerae bacterium]
MNLNEYFENTDGMGILSTADHQGNVDCAIYATPHVMDESTIAFIMRPRKSYQNIQSNPKAAYLFVEKGPGYQGKRLYLEKTGEEANPEKVNLLRRSPHGDSGDEAEAKLVYFTVIHIRPLVGDSKEK